MKTDNKAKYERMVKNRQTFIWSTDFFYSNKAIQWKNNNFFSTFNMEKLKYKETKTQLLNIKLTL